MAVKNAVGDFRRLSWGQRVMATRDSVVTRFFMTPWRDGLAGMEAALDAAGIPALVMLLLALLASWWVYVPLHELMHAWGCLLAGGSVTRLEIDELYGAAWLARLFPFVSPGSDYAGRLSGFDTGGSDWIYLVTVFFPYLLTLFPGVALVRSQVRSKYGQALVYGAAVPFAFAPFLSLAGDYYEMGSIIVSRSVSGEYPVAIARWRGDDLMLQVSTLFGTRTVGTWVDALGMMASLVLGTILAFGTYALGAKLAAGLYGSGLQTR